MTENQNIKPLEVINRNRKWYRKNRSNDINNDCRIVRTFNLIKEADAIKNYSVPKIIMLFTAFNGFYSGLGKRENIAKHKNNDTIIYSELFNQINRLDSRYDKYDMKIERQPAEPWCELLLETIQPHSRVLIDNYSLYSAKSNIDSINKEKKKLLKNILKPNNLTNIVDRIYYFRNILVHGNYDPHSSIFTEELKAAQKVLYVVLAYIIQNVLEHPSRKWGKVSHHFSIPEINLSSN